MVRTFILIAAMLLAAIPAAAVEDYDTCVANISADPESALGEALQWRDLGGGPPAKHCVAMALAANGDLKLAALRLEDLSREMEPVSNDLAAEVMAQAAAVWLQARDDLRATDAFARAVNLRPDSARLRVDLAHVLAADDRFDEAEAQVAAALRLDDLLADAYALKAMIHRKREQFGEADEALFNALALDPEQPMARMENALAQARGGDKDAARRALLDLIADYPEGDIAETARTFLEQMDVR